MRRPRCWYVRRLVLVTALCMFLVQVVWFITNKDNLSTNIKLTSSFYLNKSGVKLTAPPTSQNDSNIPILLWWDSVYTDVDEVRTCGDLQCRVTNKRILKNHPNTLIFLFYASNFKPYDLPLPRERDHLWALMHEESPRNAYILSHQPALSVFNFTSTYSMRSDYPITTQWLQCQDWIKDTKYVLPLVDKNRLRNLGLAPILYLQSDCDVPSDRDSFVKLLQNFIPVDSYGTCLQNKKMANRLRFKGNMAPMEDHHFFQFAARYKFTLAMENYVCDDYITEKLWRPLRLGSIPIVFGAPNVKDYLPSNKSALVIEDFRDVEDLADYIHLLDTRDDLYKQYLTFKEESSQNNHLKQILESRDWISPSCFGERFKKTVHNNETYTSFFSGYECFLCKKAHTYIRSNKQNNFRVKTDAYGCPSPRRFDNNGRYSVHSDVWSAEWNYGKFEAEAMIKLYETSSVMKQKDFYKFVKKIIKEQHSS